MKKGFIYFHATLLLLSSNTYAIDDTAEQSDNNVRTLLITGSRVLQNIEGSSEQLDEYNNQAIIDAGELLLKFPGFSAIRAGGHGIDPVLRGQSQTRINLLQQSAFLHGAGPNRMDSPGSYTEPFGWDEVQIIKGVESLTLGTGGPAGSINFKRYRPLTDDGISGQMMAAYSSDYHKFGADLAAGNDSSYFRLISQHHQQDSYKDGNDNSTRTAFETKSNTFISGYTPDENTELRLSIMVNRGSDALFAGTMMDGPQTDMDAAQLLFIDGNQHSNNYSEYQVYSNKAHHIMDNFSLREQTAPMRMLTDSYSETQGAKWLKRWQATDIIWQASFDWQNVDRHAERYMSMMGIPNMLQSNLWPQNTLDIKGVAVEAEYLINDQARIKSGVRYDKVKAEASDENQDFYSIYYTNTPTKSEEDNLSVFSRYYANSENSLYWLGLSSTVRTADASERYVAAKNNIPMMRWIGNPNIQPERHNQFDLGVKWRLEDGSHELNLYHDSVSDFILRDRARGQDDILLMDMATIYHNVDAVLYGLEWSLQKNFADSWMLHTQLAYVRGENSETNQPLYQIPPIEGLIQLSKEDENLAYWLDVRWVLSQKNVDADIMTGSGLDAGESKAWTAVDFKIRYALNSNLQLSAGIHNLFDATYAYHVSRANIDPFNPEPIRVNEPGRQIWISVLTEL